MSGDPSTRVFLRAEWRHLAMANYTVDPEILQPLVPAGTELDCRQGAAYVSVVGFRFLRTAVCGVRVPMHGAFEEVNLRFYVRRRVDGDWRRGVVFFRELAPRRLICTAARLFYNEQYRCVPMRHRIESQNGNGISAVEYAWQFRDRPGRLRLSEFGPATVPSADTEAGFISDHVWGYARNHRGRTIEYRVNRPAWTVAHANHVSFECDVEDLYGPQFVEPLSQPPSSAFLVDGSAIELCWGKPITP